MTVKRAECAFPLGSIFDGWQVLFQADRSTAWMIKVRNSWLCVWGVRAGVQEQCPGEGSVEAEYRVDCRQLGGGTGRLKSVQHRILCHTVLEHLHGGSIWRAGRFTARHADAFGGKAVCNLSFGGNLSVGILSFSGNFGSGKIAGRNLAGRSLAGTVAATWRACFVAAVDLCVRVVWSEPATRPALVDGYARPPFAAYYADPDHATGFLATGFHAGRSHSPGGDWRARLSGAAGGIPPARS